MIRQTGGFSFGATSTRSRPASRARFSASSVGMIPSCSPSPAITRIGVIRICSFMRCCFSMARASRTRMRIQLRRPGRKRTPGPCNWHELCRRHSSSAFPASSGKLAVCQAFPGRTAYYPKARGAASTGLRKLPKTGFIVPAADHLPGPLPWALGGRRRSGLAGQPAVATPRSAGGRRRRTAAASTLQT